MEGAHNETLLREEQGQKIVEFLSRTNAYEYFQQMIKNPEKIPEKFEEFLDFIIRINGIARDIPIAERKPDGENVLLSGMVEDHLVPHQKDKEGLLKLALEKLPELKNPEDKSYVLPAVINAVHLFVDGNGRTSRVINILLTPNLTYEEFNEKIRRALGEDGRLKSLNINSGKIDVDIEKIVCEKHGMEFKKGKDWEVIWPKGINRSFYFSLQEVKNPKAIEFMKKRKSDNAPCFISAYGYLREKGLLDQIIENSDYASGLSLKKMDMTLSDQDWEKILERYYDFKKECVEVLIDCFIDTEKYRTLDNNSTLRDCLVDSINKEYEVNNPK